MTDPGTPSAVTWSDCVATPDSATRRHVGLTHIPSMTAMMNIAADSDCTPNVAGTTPKHLPVKFQSHGQTVLGAWKGMLKLLDADEEVVIDGHTLDVAKVVAVAR